MTHFLISNETTYILSLPQGKPNTKYPIENGVQDERPRIPQPPQKGLNCTYYSMNILRKRIGPNHDSDYAEARRIEKLCSDFYKTRTVLYIDFKIFLPKFVDTLITKGHNHDYKNGTMNELIPIIKFYLKYMAERGSDHLSTFA